MKSWQAAALLAAILCAAGRTPAGCLPAGYYRSDSIGLALEPLPGAASQEPYLLRVQWRGGLETRTLYHEGKELRRWELSAGMERVFEAA